MSYASDTRSKEFEDKSEYVDHLTNDSAEKSATNIICDMDSIFKRDFCQEGFPERCKLSEKDFQEWRDCVDHSLRNSGETSVINKIRQKVFTCGICYGTYINKKFFVEHLRSHSDRNFFKCGVCGETFLFTQYHADHSCVDIEGRTFNCTKAFSIKAKHNTLEGENLCNICGILFPKHYSMDSHIRVHEKENGEKKNLVCSVCKMNFDCKYSFDMHFRTHFVAKSVANNVCGTDNVFKHDFCREGFPERCEFSKKDFEERRDCVDHPLRNSKETSVIIEVRQKNFTCGICYETYINELFFVEHLRNHSEGKLFKCGVCGKAFSFIQSYTNHSCIDKKGRPCKCTKALSIKATNNTQEGENVCNICGILFPKYYSMDSHIHVHEKENAACNGEKFVCNVCRMNFDYKYSFDMHFRIHSIKKSVSNYVCGTNNIFKHDFTQEGFSERCELSKKDFEEQRDCVDHPLRNSGEISVVNEIRHNFFSCGICYETYINEKFFIEHLRSHSKRKPFKCGICGKTFLYIQHYANHSCVDKEGRTFKCTKALSIKAKNNTLEGENSCGICGILFPKCYQLDSHVRVHEKENGEYKNFACNICEMNFDYKYSFDMHFQTHSVEYKCDLCQKTFSHPKQLEIHFLTHTRKPFHCKICRKHFSRKSHCGFHSSSHCSEKLFICDKCGKAFKLKHSLFAHLRKHACVFKCNVCDKTFVTKQNLEVHYREHSEEKHYDCPFCGKPCYQNDCLERHMQSHIQVNPSSSIKEDE